MESKRPTMELSDAGGQGRTHCQLTWPARVRSSDLVGRFHLWKICLCGVASGVNLSNVLDPSRCSICTRPHFGHW